MQKKEREKLKKIEKIYALSSKTKEEVLAEIKKLLFDLESYIHLENVLKRVHSRRASDYEPNTIPYQVFVDFKNRVVDIFQNFYVNNLSLDERRLALNSRDYKNDFCYLVHIKGEIVEKFSRCKRRKNVPIPFLWNLLTKLLGEEKQFKK